MNDLAVTESEVTEMQELFLKDCFRTKKGIQAFSDYIASLPDNLGENPFPLFHKFAEGVYTREIHIPKGHVIVGKLHNHECMVYMIKGKVLVADENGVRMVEAPCQFVSAEGIKRIGFVIEDVVWIDIHHTKKTTVEEAEEELFRTNYSEFELLCEEMGYSLDEVKEQTLNTKDQIEVENKNILIKESSIDGMGLFAAETDVSRFTRTTKPNKNDTLTHVSSGTVKENEGMLKLQGDGQTGGAEVLPDVSCGVHEGEQTKALGTQRTGENESDGEGLCERLQTSRKTDSVAMREMRGEKLADAPRGLHETPDSKVALSEVSPRIAFRAGQTIGIARIRLNRTQLGRYANHSFKPNATCEIKNNSIYYVANQVIQVDDEITVDYKQARKIALELDAMLENQNDAGWMACQS